MNISFIGAGNVATHLARALAVSGCKILSVHTRSEASARHFAAEHHCQIALQVEDIPLSDIYIFSIKDDNLPEVVATFGKTHPSAGLCLHTAGSMPMEIFSGHVQQYGVIYPLQTFSKKRQLDYQKIPFFIEANTDENLERIRLLANSISGSVYPLNSEQRKMLHLAAVFACNFSNHCFAIAASLLEKSELPAKLLVPLITETCSKLNDMSPVEGQTGPAVRYDQKVMEKQVGLLGDDTVRKNIYLIMSQSIHEYSQKFLENQMNNQTNKEIND